jgi:hypothetical protein
MSMGIHLLIYSRNPEQTLAILQKALRARTVDAGGGSPIMALPPAEIAVHPTDGVPSHELWLVCDNLEKTVDELARVGIQATETIIEETWGKRTTIALGGDEKLGLYGPLHPRAYSGDWAASTTIGLWDWEDTF